MKRGRDTAGRRADATHLSGPDLPTAVYRPPLDLHDARALVSCLVLFGLAFLVYPVESYQVVFVLMAFVVSLAWLAFFLQKWLFAGE